MRLTTLIENNPDKDNMLINEHGLSIFIETEKKNILFDTGQSGNFIKNAQKLNIDLKCIDTIVLSHSHYDHCNGLKKLLENYHIKPQLIVGNKFFENSSKYHFNPNADIRKCENIYRYNGINFDESFLQSKEIKIQYVKENMYKIGEEVYVFTNFKRIHAFEKANEFLKIKKNENDYVTDFFEEEISVGIKTEKGMLILLGCSHPGFLNIIDSIKDYSGENISGVIGGTHLAHADMSRIEETAVYLKKLDLNLLGFSHCTGEKASQILNKCSKHTYINRTGSCLEI